MSILTTGAAHISAQNHTKLAGNLKLKKEESLRRRRRRSSNDLRPFVLSDKSLLLNGLESADKLPPMLIVAQKDTTDDVGGVDLITIPPRGKEKWEPKTKKVKKPAKASAADDIELHENLQSVAKAAQEAAKKAMSSASKPSSSANNLDPPVGVPAGIPAQSWFQLMRHFVPMLPIMIKSVSNGVSGSHRDDFPPQPAYVHDSGLLPVQAFPGEYDNIPTSLYGAIQPATNTGPVPAAHQYFSSNGVSYPFFTPVPAAHQYAPGRSHITSFRAFQSFTNAPTVPSDPFNALPDDAGIGDDLDDLARLNFKLANLQTTQDLLGNVTTEMPARYDRNRDMDTNAVVDYGNATVANRGSQGIVFGGA